MQLAHSDERITGVLSVFNGVNKAVSNNGKQLAPEGSGVESFEFWCPQRRPEGQNIALWFAQPIHTFTEDHVKNGIDRPTIQPNAWVAELTDAAPTIELSWNEVKSIDRIDLVFDTDTDHPMESVLMTHPETVMPFCVRNYHVEDEHGNVVYRKKDNYHTRNEIRFESPVETKELKIILEHPSANVPASLFSLRCYSLNHTKS